MAAIPWMPLYVSDYLADTGHLGTIDHGAYFLMMMHYWTKGPLPTDDGQLRKIARMTPREWADARGVLLDFFQLDGGVYRHKRIDQELETATGIISKKARAGSLGAESKWKNRANQNTRSQRLAEARDKACHTPDEWLALLGVCGHKCVRCGAVHAIVKDHIVPIYQGGSDGIENLQPLCKSCNSSKGAETTDHRPHDWQKRLAECLANVFQTPAPLPSPSPSIGESSGLHREPRAGKARSPRNAKTAIPDNFPDDEARRRAQKAWNEKGRPDLAASVMDEIQKFRDHHIANGKTSADWPASWRTWITKAPGFTPQQRMNGHGLRESPLQQSERIARELIREDASNEGADSSPSGIPRIALRSPSDERH